MFALDAGLWLFAGLLALFIWRGLCWWRCCGLYLRFINYVSLLLVLVLALIVYNCFVFYHTFALLSQGNTAWDRLPVWLKVVVYACPVVVWVTYVMAAHLIYQHQVCIQEGSAILKHDRSIQIIALPVVYSTMCLSCMVQCFAYVVTVDSNHAGDKNMAFVIAKAETCLWIGDLYESWALYQFGVLSLEVMKNFLMRQSLSPEPEERAAANALLVAHPAVVRLAWVGIMAFVLTSVTDAGVALFYLVFGSGSPQLVHKFYKAESSLNYAGFMACCAAIFNVYVVESQFHQFLEEFFPYLKFLTVKILISFAYGEQYFFIILQTVYDICSPQVQEVMNQMPILGTLVHFNRLEFNLFYSALLVLECLLVGVMHLWAWKKDEPWYNDEDELGDEDSPEPHSARSGSTQKSVSPKSKLISEAKALLPAEAVLYGAAAHHSKV